MAEGEDLVDAALAHGVSPVALLVDPERVPDDDPRLAATEGLAERYRVPGQLLAQASGWPRPARHRDRPAARGAQLPRRALPARRSASTSPAWPTPGTSAPWCAPPRPSAPTGSRSGRARPTPSTRAPCAPRWAPRSPLPLLEGVTPADLATREGFDVVAPSARRGRAVGGRPRAAPGPRPRRRARGTRRRLEELGADREVVRVTIPQAAGSESLNVAAAGAALLAGGRPPARRRRRGGRTGPSLSGP